MRVLITRAGEDAGEFAAALEGIGIESLIEPMMTIAFDKAARVPLDGVQAVLATSKNGVRALAGATTRRDVPLYAVGGATGEAAGAAGFAHVESADGDVDDLARLAMARLAPNAGRLLHVAGRHVAGDLAGNLRASGFAVDRIVLYHAEAATAFSAAARRAIAEGAVDGVTFFSPRSARIFVDLLGAAALAAACRRLDVFAISANAARAAAGPAWRSVHVAQRPDQESLLRLLEQQAYAKSQRKGEP